jgi:cysteine desulfurase
LADIIYFDNSATTGIYPEVLHGMNDVYSSLYGNPSSLHKIGSDAEKVLHNAREIIAKTLGAEEDEIYFTSGGTESNNWAIKGTSRANRKRGSHIITSAIEHPSVLESFSHLETEGFSSEILEVGADGLLDPKRIGSKVNDETILASFILVNNETGAIQKADELIHAIRYRNPKTIIHVDAVQAYGKIPVNLSRLDVDLLSISAHKIHGPKGCGALYIRKNTRIHPIIHGGGQERRFRSGTENVPGIYGFALAAEIIHQHMEQNRKNAGKLRSIIIQGLSDIFSQCQYSINSPEDGYEGILNISFPRVKAQVLMHHLEAENIIVSVGSACSSRKNAYSHVLKAMKLPKENIEGAIRLSFSGTNTQEEAIRFLEAIRKIVPAIRY